MPDDKSGMKDTSVELQFSRDDLSAEAPCIRRPIERDILIAITHKVQVSEELEGSDLRVTI